MKKLVLLTFAALMIAACGGKNDQSELEKIEKDVFTVSAQTAQKRDVSQDLLITGSVKAWEEAVIYPRIDGKLLQNVLREGDSVSRNQTIALIERDEVGAVYEPVIVPSTINGVIGKTYLDPGQNVTKSTAVALVVNQRMVRISVDIPERYVGKVKIGQKATFTLEAYGDKKFSAEVYKISPVVDEQSRVVTVELKALNSDNLIKTGMFANVSLLLETRKNVLSVPLNAIEKEEKTGATYVYVINGDSVVRTEVSEGLASQDFAEIKSGLQEGASVAKVMFGLKDGSKIKIEGK